MDTRQNFTKMTDDGRKRVIAAIKWMKTHERGGVDGATVTSSTNGGVYQRYVLFHAQGAVEAELADFTILLSPEPKDMLESIVIDGEKWVSPAKQPVTEAGLKAFLDAMPISPGGQAPGGPFNTTAVSPTTPIPLLVGNINNSPFANITLRVIPDGATAPVDRPFARTPKPPPKFRLETYQMAHRSPAFLPWHRVLLRVFERDLQFADAQLNPNKGTITLPYWDWSRDNDWDDKAKSSVWHKENFGGFSDTPEGTITGDHFSPASGWELFDGTRTKLTGIDGELRRRRIADRGGKPSDTLPPPTGVFPTAKAVEGVIANADYIGKKRGGGGGHDGSGGNKQFAGRLEYLLHDTVHVAVGGSANPPARTQDGQMSDPLFSPQDPIFWLFHCNVDRHWSRWQWLYDKGNDSKYPEFGMLPGRRRDDPMQPWAVSANVPPYQFNVRIKDVFNAANFSSAVNAANLLGKGYRYDSLAL